MEVRKLTLSDRDNLEDLISVVEQSLVNPDFWLPIDSVSREHFFDDQWTEFQGIFAGDTLVAAAALFFSEHEYGSSLRMLEINSTNVAELGRIMVRPQHRGNHLAREVGFSLVDTAKQRGIEYILATVHPQNIPSQKTVKALKLEKQLMYTKYTKNGSYVRDVFLRRLS